MGLGARFAVPDINVTNIIVCVRYLCEGDSVDVWKEVKEEENVNIDSEARSYQSEARSYQSEARSYERSLERGSDFHLVVKATARNLR